MAEGAGRGVVLEKGTVPGVQGRRVCRGDAVELMSET